MERFKHPLARAFAVIVVLVNMIITVTPFTWSTITAFKYPVEANRIKPRIWGFESTLSNFETLWLNCSIEAFKPYFFGILGIFAILLIFYTVNKIVKLIKPYVVGIIITGIITLVLFTLPELVPMADFYDYFLNTIIVTASTLAISLFIGCMGGYALARYSGKAGVVILILALIFRALPPMARVLPYYYLGQISGLYDTLILLVIALIATNQPFTIWMLRSFFMTIPKALEEAAMIDGLNRFQAFFIIILPVVWPGVITTGLFTLLLAYNEFLLPRILTQTNWTVPVAISGFTSGEDAAYRTIAAAASFSIAIPIIIVVIFFQKYLISGMTSGAVKG